jgi:hypothetical protein
VFQLPNGHDRLRPIHADVDHAGIRNDGSRAHLLLRLLQQHAIAVQRRQHGGAILQGADAVHTVYDRDMRVPLHKV